MNDEIRGPGANLLKAASEIVAAYVSNNHVAPMALPELLGSVHATLADLADSRRAVPVERPSAAEIRKSVQRDGIVSFLDGRSYKTLKRHLAANGLAPATYRERYGLPVDYPMVAPSYSEQRSSLAKAIGLGVPGARAEDGAEARRKAA